MHRLVLRPEAARLPPLLPRLSNPDRARSATCGKGIQVLLGALSPRVALLYLAQDSWVGSLWILLVPEHVTPSLASHNAGPRLGNLLAKLLLFRLHGWELIVGSSISMQLLGAPCVLHVRGMAAGPGSDDLDFGQITWETQIDTMTQGMDSTSDEATNPLEALGVLQKLEKMFGPAVSAGVHHALMAGLRLKAKPLDMFGGYHRQLSALKQLIILPLNEPELYNKLRIVPPRGILLYGPPGANPKLVMPLPSTRTLVACTEAIASTLCHPHPGTGKTMLASKVAQLADASVLVVNGGEFISEVTGESEATLKAIFTTARRLQPSVSVFLPA